MKFAAAATLGRDRLSFSGRSHDKVRQTSGRSPRRGSLHQGRFRLDQRPAVGTAGSASRIEVRHRFPNAPFRAILGHARPSRETRRRASISCWATFRSSPQTLGFGKPAPPAIPATPCRNPISSAWSRTSTGRRAAGGYCGEPGCLAEDELAIHPRNELAGPSLRTARRVVRHLR